MQRALLGLGLGPAMIAGPAAAANADDDARSARTHVMWFPSDRLWNAALPGQGCNARAIAPTGDLALSTPVRRATWERRGELLAELRGSPQTSRATLDTARTCATRAADPVVTPGLLSAAIGPWSTFQGALAACLKEKGAAGGLGSMTLWIDTSCNW
jgi:hypothetical protein